MVKCPIIDREIDIGECVTIVDVCEGAVKESVLPEEVKRVANWREVCRNCKYHNN